MTTSAATKERLKFEFGRHETFAVRHGWLGKGIDHMLGTDAGFQDEEIAVVKLGLGTRMVKSLRYWMEATGLAEREILWHKSRQSRGLRLTRLAHVIQQQDPYLEYPATWWFVHLNLARRMNSVWGWLFSDFRERNFDRSVCVEAYVQHLRLNAAKEPSHPVAQRDVACALLAYATSAASESQDPEDGTSSPLRDLGLLVKYTDTGRFEKTRPLDSVPLEAFAVCVALAAADVGQEAMSVGEMLGRRGGPGTVFNLDAETIEDLAIRAAVEFKDRGVGLDLLGAERRLRVPITDAAEWLDRHFQRIGTAA